MQVIKYWKNIFSHQAEMLHYISKTTQNEIINICGNLITETIVADIFKAKYSTIICDETTYSGHKKQLCFCVRFVDNSEGIHKICEEFLNFQSADDLTAAGLSSQFLLT